MQTLRYLFANPQKPINYRTDALGGFEFFSFQNQPGLTKETGFGRKLFLAIGFFGNYFLICAYFHPRQKNQKPFQIPTIPKKLFKPFTLGGKVSWFKGWFIGLLVNPEKFQPKETLTTEEPEKIGVGVTWGYRLWLRNLFHFRNPRTFSPNKEFGHFGTNPVSPELPFFHMGLPEARGNLFETFTLNRNLWVPWFREKN